MAAESDLQSLLEELSGQGKFDSSGKFQIDLSRSLAKLTRFTHRSADFFMLHLASAAVALGARYLEVQTADRLWSFEFDGRPLGLDDLKQVFPSLSIAGSGSADFALRELALALSNGHGLAGCHLHLSGDQAVLELAPHFLSLGPAAKTAIGRTRLEVRFPSFWQRVRQRSLAGQPPPLPQELFLWGTRFSGLERRLLGKVVDLPAPPPLVASLHVRGREPLPALAVQAEIREEIEEDSDASLFLGVLSGFLAPGSRPPIRHSVLTVVHWGLTFEVEAPWCLEGTVALLVHNGLKRDLLGRELVRDGLLSAASNWAEDHLIALVERLLHSTATAPWQIEAVERIVRRPNIPPRWSRVVHNIRNSVNYPLVRQLKATYQRYGFLLYDPARFGHRSMEILRMAGSTHIPRTPHRPWEPPLGQWLMGIPTSFGEIHYSSEWPGQPATTSALPLEQVRRLPVGMQLYLQTAPAQQDWMLQLRLFKRVFLNLLEADPRRFLGSAPALRLAIWLTRTLPAMFPANKSRIIVSKKALTMHLRLYPAGSMQLSTALSRPGQSYILEGSEPAQDCNPVPWLSQAELDLLMDYRPGHWRPFLNDGGFPEGRREAMCELVYRALDRTRGNRAGLLWLPPILQEQLEDPSVLFARGFTHFERGRRYQDVTSGETLLALLTRRVPLGEAWFSTSAVFKEGQIDPATLTHYVCASFPAREGANYCLYVERRARRGPFSQVETAALEQMATQAGL